MDNRPLLLITYYWPPAAGPGVQRWLKFSKYLPEGGWQPIVLTVRNGSYPAVDHSLTEEVRPGIPVYRAPSLEPHAVYNMLKGKKGKKVEGGMSTVKDSTSWYERAANFVRSNLFVPDARMGWNVFAYPKAKRIIRDHGVQAVITTGPPQSTHLIGLRLKNKFGLPWIADLRDPWTTVFYNQYLLRTKAANRWDRGLEDRVIRHADAVTVVSPGMKEEFEGRNPNTQVIYNGYEEEDFPLGEKEAGEHFVLSYVGNFKIGQNHDPLWDAIGKLLRDDPEFRDAFRFRFTGNVNQYVRQRLQHYGILEHCVFRGYRPHKEAVRDMYTADMLLFIISETRGNEKLVSGKLFEYLASRTPIFGIGVPGGNADLILQECERQPIFGFHRTNEYKAYLLKMFLQWQANGKLLTRATNDRHRKYSRSSQAEKYSSLLDRLSEDQPVNPYIRNANE